VTPLSNAAEINCLEIAKKLPENGSGAHLPSVPGAPPSPRATSAASPPASDESIMQRYVAA